jgi:hypothetical protein
MMSDDGRFYFWHFLFFFMKLSLKKLVCSFFQYFITNYVVLSYYYAIFKYFKIINKQKLSFYKDKSFILSIHIFDLPPLFSITRGITLVKLKNNCHLFFFFSSKVSHLQYRRVKSSPGAICPMMALMAPDCRGLAPTAP